MVTRGGSVLVVVASMLAGCELIAGIPNATSRGDADDGGTVDVAVDDNDATPVACSNNQQCTTPIEPVCLLPQGQCVECVVSTDCTNPAEAVCGADHTCRVCDLDDDCGANGVCLLGGTCAAEARILYAAPAGSGTDCSAAAPCTIVQAHASLGTARDIIKLAPGLYTQSTLAFTGQAPVITLAGTGATLTSTAMYMPAVSINMGRLDVTGVVFESQDLRFGATCTAATMNFVRVTMQNGSIGMYASPDPCNVTFDRSIVRANVSYALYLTAGTLFARNSLFAGNGTPTLTIAALYIPGTTGLVEFSTFANNLSDAQPAIGCDNAGFVVRNSISFANPAPISAACPVSYSNIEAGYAGAANNNLTMDPQFVGVGDYHLMPASPMREVADPATPVLLDIDNEVRPRPVGTRADIGFDEVL